MVLRINPSPGTHQVNNSIFRDNLNAGFRPLSGCVSVQIWPGEQIKWGNGMEEHIWQSEIHGIWIHWGAHFGPAPTKCGQPSRATHWNHVMIKLECRSITN